MFTAAKNITKRNVILCNFIQIPLLVTNPWILTRVKQIYPGRVAWSVKIDETHSRRSVQRKNNSVCHDLTSAFTGTNLMSCDSVVKAQYENAFNLNIL